MSAIITVEGRGCSSPSAAGGKLALSTQRRCKCCRSAVDAALTARTVKASIFAARGDFVYTEHHLCPAAPLHATSPLAVDKKFSFCFSCHGWCLSIYLVLAAATRVVALVATAMVGRCLCYRGERRIQQYPPWLCHRVTGTDGACCTCLAPSRRQTRGHHGTSFLFFS